MPDRTYDLVVLGATGFTGGLVAEHLAAHAPAGARWAIAGRNQAKLDAVRERLGADIPTVAADTTDEGSLRDLAASTTALITTVGPYIHYGPPVVAACAEEGTGYLDLTGEPEFMDQTYVRHHARATETGARLLHACGFDSIPHDLGAQFTVEQLPEGVPLRVEGHVRMGGTVSGGTLASALEIMARQRQGMKVHKERLALEPDTTPPGRRVRAVLGKPHRDGETGRWLLPMPTIDPQVVRASGRALGRYGPDFAYAAYVAQSSLPKAAGLAAGFGGLAAAAQVPPLRKLIAGRIPAGTGPSPERRARSWFEVRFTGEGGGERVVTTVSGGDPGYGETAVMLAEAGLCLALDDVPQTAGQVTTAQALGPALRERLIARGIRFERVA